MIPETDESLKRYSEMVLLPTVNMVFGTALELYLNRKKERHIEQALMDSFRIHARSLLLFFYGTNFKSDDAQAQHYMKSGVEWVEVRRDQTPALLDLRRRVGKEVAHLTYSRDFEVCEIKDWDIGSELRDLYLIFQDFFRNANEARLHASIYRAPQFWRALFRRSEASRGTGVPVSLGRV